MEQQVRTVLIVAIMLIIGTIVRVYGNRILLYFNKKEQENAANENLILQPLYYLFAGIFIAVIQPVLCLVLMIVPTVDNENRELPWILLMAFTFGLVWLVGIFCIMLRLNWRIEIHEDGFSFRNSFRVTKRYSFEEITEINTGRAYRYYKGKKKILAISMLQPNCFLLAEAFFKWKSKKRIASNE